MLSGAFGSSVASALLFLVLRGVADGLSLVLIVWDGDLILRTPGGSRPLVFAVAENRKLPMPAFWPDRSLSAVANSPKKPFTPGQRR
jgi:hypothetical protein